MKKLSNSKTELKKSIVYKNKACSQILLLLLLLCEEIPQVYYKRNKLMNKIDWFLYEGMQINWLVSI